jgi:hypothetical protein
MDEGQLKTAIGRDPYLKRFSWGVFARDELPRDLFPGAYLVNTQDRGTPGQHWFALFVTEDGLVEFADSLGRKPTDYKIRLDCIYYSDAVQPPGSELCGLYVLYYLYWRTRNIPFHVIMSTLNTEHNDSVVKAHYATRLNK